VWIDTAATFRILHIGPSTFVVSVAGEADAAAAATLGATLGDLSGHALIVDLLRARNVDGDMHAAIRQSHAVANVTVVAEPAVLHSLELVDPTLRLEPSLSAAVARVV
jgi:hypothetical protein